MKEDWKEVFGEDQFDEFEEEGKFDSSDFIGDLRLLVLFHINSFFGHRKMHCGGKIPKRFLHSRRRISSVLNTNIISGIDSAYNALESLVCRNDREKSRRNGTTTDDIKLVNETLNTLAQEGIPREFAGGFLLMYLEFCKGVKIE